MSSKKFLKGFSRPFLNRLRPGNVAMFHIGRCGSTVLGGMLEQHACIHWASEIYQPIFSEWQKEHSGVETLGAMPEDAVKLLQKDMKKALHRFYGCEIKPFHLKLIGYSQERFLRSLDSLGFTHYILLDRENRLRKIISSLIAHDKKRYHLNAENQSCLTKKYLDVSDVKIDFDAKPLLDFLADYDKQMNLLQELLKNKNVLQLKFESDIEADPRRAYLRICEFLDISPEETSVRLSRTNPFRVADMVENIDEVRECLRGTPYKWMLEG